MPYLGKSPSQGVRTRFQFTPNAGTTSISGADANGLTLSFTDGNYVDVYLNGVMLKAGVDYNTNTANTIAGLSATVASDVVDIVVYDTFSVFGGTLEGNVKVNNGTFNVTGAVDFDSTLNVDGVVTTDGATHDGDVTFTGANYNAVWDKSDNALEFGDNAKAKFGAGDDLQIYHNGSHSYISDQGTGNLYIQGDGQLRLQSSTGENYLIANLDDAVHLYYDNNLKLSTTSTGVDVTGTVTADGLNVEIEDNNSGPVTIQQGGNSYFKIVTTNSSETVELGNSTTNPNILLGGGNVGIGDTSPSNRLSVVAADGDADNAYVATFQNQEATDDRNFGVLIKAGSTATDSALVVTDHDASNNLFFVKGNGNAFIGGSVAIGTSSANYDVQVHQSDSTNSIIQFTNSTTGTTSNDGLLVGINSSEQAQVFNRENTDLLFATNNSERMRIDSSGNVGIGTTSPSAGLHIDNPDDSQITAILDTDNSAVKIVFRNNTETGNNVQIGADGSSLVALTNATERMRLGTSEAVFNEDSNDYDFRIESNDIATMFCVDGANNSIGVNTLGVSGSMFTIQGPAGTSGNNISTKALHVIEGGFNTGNTFQVSNASSVSRFAVDGDGNVLVGTTVVALSDATSGSGIALQADGQLEIAKSGSGSSDVCARFNRSTDDGPIVEFRKSGSTVGSIFSSGGIQIGIGDGDTALLFADNIDAVLPWSTSNTGRDDVIDLGRSATRFDDIHATNGTIQTSDENEKQDIASMTTAELAVGKRLSTLFKTFRWKSKVTEKADKARTHSGIIAQQVKAAFEAEGLDATKYALFCSDTWTNDDGKEQTRMGVRYPELLSFVASYNESRFTAIEARITKLEGG